MMLPANPKSMFWRRYLPHVDEYGPWVHHIVCYLLSDIDELTLTTEFDPQTIKANTNVSEQDLDCFVKWLSRDNMINITNNQIEFLI
jgi:hypothetical protein